MVKLYIAIRQETPNFKLPYFHTIVDMQYEGTPFVYDKRPGHYYQTLTAKGKTGSRNLDILVESLADLPNTPVELVAGHDDIQVILDHVNGKVGKLIRNSRAKGHSYEHAWRRNEHSTANPLYPWGFGAFPEPSAVVRVSFICVQERDQTWRTVHTWQFDD
jgi:hypothetical protein